MNPPPTTTTTGVFFQEETSRLNPELVRFQRVDRPLTGPRPAAAAPAAKEPANPLKNKNTHNSRARSSGGGRLGSPQVTRAARPAACAKLTPDEPRGGAADAPQPAQRTCKAATSLAVTGAEI